MKYLGFKDIFTKRFYRFLWQDIKWGYDESDTWNLDVTIAKFVLPRLKLFQKLKTGYPYNRISGEEELSDYGFKTFEDWNNAIEDMIFAMEFLIREDKEVLFLEKTDRERVKRGLNYFGKYFSSLWW